MDLPEPSGATYEALRKYFDKESFNGNPLDIEELHWANRSVTSNAWKPSWVTKTSRWSAAA